MPIKPLPDDDHDDDGISNEVSSDSVQALLPRQTRRQSKQFLPGRARMRGPKGGSISLGGPRMTKSISDGRLRTFNKRMSIIDPNPYPPDPRPLTRHAIDLLGDFLLRDPFWRAVEDLHLSVEKAGQVILKVQKSQAAKVYRELEAYEGSHGRPPLAWFRARALDGIKGGKIGRGRDTQPSRLADSFFLALGGGPDYARNLKDWIGVRSELDVREIPVEDEIERQINEYWIYSNNIYKGDD
jgi:hypothetical protein